jgi:hypothetical protein
VRGASTLIRPAHSSVANAIGAAIAQVGGEIDRVFSLEHRSRDDALDEARREAMRNAAEAGADPDSLKIVDEEEMPLSYLPRPAARIRVKAVGDLRLA